MAHFEHYGGHHIYPVGGYYPYPYGYEYNSGPGFGQIMENVLGNILPQVFGRQGQFFGMGPQAQWNQSQAWNQSVNGYPLPNVKLRDPIERDAAIAAKTISDSMASQGQADLGTTERFMERALRIDRHNIDRGRQTDFSARLERAIDRNLQQLNPRYRFSDNASTGYRPQIVEAQAGYYQGNGDGYYPDDDSNYT